MENGVKAVFIAVAACITIAVFTFVAKIYKNNATLTEKGAMSFEQDVVTVHNSQFSSYFAKKLTLSEARILINTIYNSNERNIANKQDELMISLYIKSGVSGIYETDEKIKNKINSAVTGEYLGLKKYSSNISRLLCNYLETLDSKFFMMNADKLERDKDGAIIGIYLDPVN